jgi:AcrR family transcriptional regulator
MTEPSRSARPSVEARCAQILEAATRCVRQAGFHGASMAEIAQAAGLSVGQIYRYFENKESIVAAIVAQDVAEMRERFSELPASGAPLLQAILENVPDAIARSYDPDRAAVWLEVLAEAARNSRVAEILRRADAEERQLRMGILRRAAPPGCSTEELVARGEVLSMVFEGMVVRGLNNPDGDRAAIAQLLSSVIRRLLTDPPAGQPGA